MTKQQKTKFVKTINTYRDVHTKHFRDIKWLRHTLSEFLPKDVVEHIVWEIKF